MNKLLEFQKRVGAIKKDSTNPYYKSKYADINTLLETVKPVLNELEIVVIQPLEVKDGKTILTTQVLDGNVVLATSAIILPDNPDPQKIGSAITYYRRYSLQSLLLLEAEDDDANSAKPTKTMSKQINQQDDSTLAKIKECKTTKDLEKLWATLDPEEQPIYLDKFSTRKAILTAK